MMVPPCVKLPENMVLVDRLPVRHLPAGPISDSRGISGPKLAFTHWRMSLCRHGRRVGFAFRQAGRARLVSSIPQIKNQQSKIENSDLSEL